jgi:hypothetical protein
VSGSGVGSGDSYEYDGSGVGCGLGDGLSVGVGVRDTVGLGSAPAATGELVDAGAAEHAATTMTMTPRIAADRRPTRVSIPISPRVRPGCSGG